MIKRMSKKQLLEIYKNNFEVVSKRKQELYNENIELQKKVIEQEKIIGELRKAKQVLKSKLTRCKNELNKYKNIEIAPSVEKGNKIIQEILSNQKVGEK